MRLSILVSGMAAALAFAAVIAGGLVANGSANAQETPTPTIDQGTPTRTPLPTEQAGSPTETGQAAGDESESASPTGTVAGAQQLPASGGQPLGDGASVTPLLLLLGLGLLLASSAGFFAAKVSARR